MWDDQLSHSVCRIILVDYLLWDCWWCEWLTARSNGLSCLLLAKVLLVDLWMHWVFSWGNQTFDSLSQFLRRYRSTAIILSSLIIDLIDKTLPRSFVKSHCGSEMHLVLSLCTIGRIEHIFSHRVLQFLTEPVARWWKSTRCCLIELAVSSYRRDWLPHLWISILGERSQTLLAFRYFGRCGSESLCSLHLEGRMLAWVMAVSRHIELVKWDSLFDSLLLHG